MRKARVALASIVFRTTLSHSGTSTYIIITVFVIDILSAQG